MQVNNLIGLKRKAQRAGWAKWIKSAADEEALLRGCWFDEAAGQHVVDFGETFCRLSKGEWGGKPVQFLDWQKFELLMPLFGWKDEQRLRRYREAYVEMCKKNSKSTTASILELYGLTADGEPGAEIYTAATTREQASIVHRETASMVLKSPALRSRLKVLDHTKTIKLDTSSWIRALSSDAGSVEGINAHFLIFDELHAWQDVKFYLALRWATAARKQPLILYITTAGEDLGSLCGEKHVYALKIIKGEVFDYRFFGLVYGNEPDANIDDPETWRRGNPSMPEIISEDRFREELEQAKNGSERDLAGFKRYRLGIWTKSEAVWMPMEQWREAGEHPIREEDYVGKECFSGLDLSSVSDITALVHAFPWQNVKGETCIDVLCRFWLPEELLKDVNHPNYAVYMQAWREGRLLLTPGPAIDYGTIWQQIDADAQKFNIRELAFDRWGAVQMAQQLEAGGLTVFPFAQGMKSFSPPSKELLTLVLNGRIRHGGNSLLTWMAGNVTVEQDANGNIRPVKLPRRGGGEHRKIDGIVALIMALDRAASSTGGSMYEADEVVI